MKRTKVRSTSSDSQETVSKKSKRQHNVKESENGKADSAASNSKLTAEPASTLQNQSTTDYQGLKFDCSKKNKLGQKHNIVISSWNVDGLRAWIKKGGLKYIDHVKPDILCLQETKCSKEKLPTEALDVTGYKNYWCSSNKEGYAGIGLYTKTEPINIKYGLGNEEFDIEGRCITVEYEKFFLVNVYVPNAGRKLVTLPKRLKWNGAFKDFIKDLDDKKPVIICGDMNVAHKEIDLANPKTNTKNAGFTKEERDGLTDFLGDSYTDTFRHFYPDEKGAYTFWSYMGKARSKNVGWRLDYFIVSNRILDNVCDNTIRSDVFGSDHCPITLHLNI